VQIVKLKPITLMFALTVITTFSVLFFGLIWHDQPARSGEESRTAAKKSPTDER